MKKRVCLVIILMVFVFNGCVNGKIEDVDNNENDKVLEVQPIYNEVDFSKSFGGINGSAVFYNSTNKTYDIYNSNLYEEAISPYSTFKIISALMGLSQGVIDSVDSTMGYNGEIYWKEEWNRELTLEEAFKESCIWYFENIVDSLDKTYVQDVLNDLGYGNCDLSKWDDRGHNTFWVSSSLKISPKEQIEVLSKIFEGKSDFTDESVSIVKEIMLLESGDDYSIYGKTGSAREKNSWFVGFVENKGEKIYFAIRLSDESLKLGGAKAKEIAFKVINEKYIK